MRITRVVAFLCLGGAFACGGSPKPLVPVDTALKTWEPTYQEPEPEETPAATESSLNSPKNHQ